MTIDGSVCVELQKGRKVSRNSQTFVKGRVYLLQEFMHFQGYGEILHGRKRLIKKMDSCSG